jgi:adenylate cyclase
MGIEIEHKFLLANDDWRKLVHKSVHYRQGYLSAQPTCSIRVRISGQHAWLNIKSATIGNERMEFEYEIPCSDADVIIDTLCGKPIIEKVRHFVAVEDHIWEIDEFDGSNAGLIVAEIELGVSGESFSKPSWLGQEVTDDLRYYNNNLAKNPYSNWVKK